MLATFTHLIGPKKGEFEKFDGSRILVGRASDNDLHFSDSERRVSSHHAEIVRKHETYILRDLGSTNGTMVNGRRIITTELKNDDLIEFGAGGPLLRFGLTGQRDEADDEEPSHDQSIRTGSFQRNQGQTGHERSSNLGIIIALVIALVVGALGGIVVSARLHPLDNQRSWVVEVTERNSPAVVLIRTEFELVDGRGQVIERINRSGSGFVISSRGLIVTNRHLVRDWEYNPLPPGVNGHLKIIHVMFPGQTAESAVTAEVLRLSSDRAIDVAVLNIAPGPNLAVVGDIEADLDSVNQGDEVVVIGYPLGTDLLRLSTDARVAPSISTGNVSRIARDVIQLNLRAYRGNSGGPLIDRKGRVIGILTANVAGANDITICTPISEAMQLVMNEVGIAEGGTR
jgi:S1-C subfamily serine protease